MPSKITFEQNLSTPLSSKKKFALSDIRRRFSFSPRNSVFFTKLDLEKEEEISQAPGISLSVKDNNNSKKKHQRSISECINNYEEVIEIEDDFEEEIRRYTPIFERNQNQMNNLSSYEEATNEVITDEYMFKRKTWLKIAVKRFTGVGQDKKKYDKEYQDGKTNPFE